MGFVARGGGVPEIGRPRDELYAVLKESRNRKPSDARQINHLIISANGASRLRSLAARLATLTPGSNANLNRFY
jgi:hypothetical protein